MSCLFWNCQGLGVPLTVQILGEILRTHNPEVVFLSETKCQTPQIENIKQRFVLHGLSVDSNGASGGLALLWKKDVDIDLNSYSANHIDVRVRLRQGENFWRLTGFYGVPDSGEKHLSWSLLRRLGDQTSLPWIVGGDFNEILSNAEKYGGNPKYPCQMTAFREALDECDLIDLGYQGYPYTWSNNREEPNTVRERLDRVCATTSWCDRFPYSTVHHLKAGGSDHLPIILQIRALNSTLPKHANRPKRFESYWTKDNECQEWVKELWTQSDAMISTNLIGKLQTCRDELDTRFKAKVGSLRNHISALRRKLDQLLCGPINAGSQQEITMVRNNLACAFGKEESYWRQRSRVEWLRDGDKNTAYFHRKATIRQRTNRIQGLFDDVGIWHESEEQLETIITGYFANIFASSNPSDEDIDRVLNEVPSRVSEEMNAKLCQPYSKDEVFTALNHMNPLKSPGPDGMPALFFQKYWHIVGDDVCAFVLNFLNNGILPSDANYTYVALIPKTRNPTCMSQFRPISLSNVVYKIAAKAIANRLKPLLNSLISPTQSAFVPHRLITDNVLVAFEINHYINTKKSGAAGFMALKLDMSKAYDRIEWPFLRGILLRLGFDISFVNLIMRCVTTVTYSFLLNGNCIGLIRPSRGLRQGDPLSPYLFLFCAEAFISLLTAEERNNRINGIEIARGAPRISHLFFADDTVLFCRATLSEARAVRQVLETYERASGQKINKEKSSVVVSKNISPPVRDEMAQELGFQVVEKHEMYLGLPAELGCSRREIFSYIRECIWKRLQGWGERKLSIGGREVLIKAVLQAIPTYVMSVFLLPVSLIKEIEALIRSYWWGGNGKKGISWVRWTSMCETKRNGGVGFRDLRSFNYALLAKQGWRILNQPGSLLSRLLKSKYFPSTDFHRAKLGSRPTATWRAILSARQFLNLGLRWKVGNGSQISLWNDAWLPYQYNPRLVTVPRLDSLHLRVYDIIDHSTGGWDEARIRDVLWRVDSDRVLNIQLNIPEEEDRLIWHASKDGNFSVRSCYHLCRMERSRSTTNKAEGSGTHDKNWNFIWRIKLPSKFRFFLWRVGWDALPTANKLQERGVHVSPSCPVCRHDEEDGAHVLFKCKYARDVWLASELNILMMDAVFLNPFQWMRDLRAQMDESQFELFAVTCRAIWMNRCQKPFNDVDQTCHDLVRHAKRLTEELRRVRALRDSS